MQSPSTTPPAFGWLLYALRKGISQEISALKLLNQFSTLLPNTSHKSYSGLLRQGFLFPLHTQVITGFPGDLGSSSGLFSSELICPTVCLPGQPLRNQGLRELQGTQT